MTEWTWPNEYDRKICTWTKRSHWRIWTMVLDRKSTTTTNMNGWIWPNQKIKIILLKRPTYICECDRKKICKVSLLFCCFESWEAFLGLGPFSLVFWSCSTVHVHQCNLSVKFHCSCLLVWLFFGHILTDFWSYWLDQNN